MFSRKLLFNLLLVLICGIVTISIPVIVRYQQNSARASTNQTNTTNWFLTCEFVGNQEQIDAYLVWRIYQKCGNTIVADWEDIYASINATNPLTYDTVHLKLTPQGLVYRDINTPEDYQKLYATGYSSFVIYQGKTCRLTLP